MKVSHELTVDLINSNPFKNVNAMQSDANARTLVVSLKDKGKAWEVPDGVTAAVAFKKPGGTRGLYDRLPNGEPATSIEGSKVKIILAPQVLTEPGEVMVTVVLFDKDLNRLSTLPFCVQVLEDPSGGAPASNDYYKCSTMEAVNETVDAALAELEEDEQTFLTKAEEALQAVHNTATEDALAIACEASGEGIQVTDSSDKVLKGLRICGKTTQDGTPTPDTPVEPVSIGASGTIKTTVAGKNLLGGFTNKTENGVTFTVNSDGSVHVSGTSLYSTALDATVHLLPGTYMLSGCPEGGSQSSEDGHYTLYMQILSDSGNTYYFDTGRGVVLPISVEGDYKIRILLRANTTIDKTFYPMVEVGNTVTEYEHYKGQTLAVSTPNGLPGIPVSSGGNYTDKNGQQWISDEIDFTRGVYVQRVKSVVYSGVESWTKDSGTPMDASNIFKTAEWFADRLQMDKVWLSTAFVPTRNTYGAMYDGTFTINSYGQVFVVTTQYNTAEEWKAYLSENPMTVMCALEEPIETALPDEELAAYSALHSYKPTTTVYNDAGAGLAVEYVADTKNYIDQKLAAISAAMLNN